jgi:hypothetical protein
MEFRAPRVACTLPSWTSCFSASDPAFSGTPFFFHRSFRVFYVGLELDESRLDFDFLTPDKDSWNDGKGTLICFVLDPSHDQIPRALRGAHE